MLRDAVIKATPTKYAQNKCQGIYAGTMVERPWAAERCRAPKTARGIAKHILPNATTLSSPFARAKSVLAAHRPIRKSTIPPVDMEKTVRENSKSKTPGKAAIIVCKFMRDPQTRKTERDIIMPLD